MKLFAIYSKSRISSAFRTSFAVLTGRFLICSPLFGTDTKKAFPVTGGKVSPMRSCETKESL